MNDPLRLVESSTAGATRSFEDFFEREKPGLYRALCLVTRNRHEAEEQTQDAFVRVLERWDRVGAMDDPRGYLYRTAMNGVRSRYRRTVLGAKRTFGITRPDDAMAAVDARDATIRALATLSPRQRAAVVLDRSTRLHIQGGRQDARHTRLYRPHAYLPRARCAESDTAR